MPTPAAPAIILNLSGRSIHNSRISQGRSLQVRRNLGRRFFFFFFMLFVFLSVSHLVLHFILLGLAVLFDKSCKLLLEAVQKDLELSQMETFLANVPLLHSDTHIHGCFVCVCFFFCSCFLPPFLSTWWSALCFAFQGLNHRNTFLTVRPRLISHSLA